MQALQGFRPIFLPDNNFDVFINGQLAGTSPYKSEQLDPGSYKVHVAKKNYYPVDTVFRLREGDSQIHTIKLTSYDDSLWYNRILGGRDISFGVNVGYVIPFVSASSGGSFTGSVMNYSLGDSRENASYTSQSSFTAGAFADIRLYKNFYLIAGMDYTLYRYKNTFDQPFDGRIVSATSYEANYASNYQNSYVEKYTHQRLGWSLLASYRFVLTKTGISVLMSAMRYLLKWIFLVPQSIAAKYIIRIWIILLTFLHHTAHSQDQIIPQEISIYSKDYKPSIK